MLNRRKYKAGETIRISITLTSFDGEPIELDNPRLSTCDCCMNPIDEIDMIMAQDFIGKYHAYYTIPDGVGDIIIKVSGTCDGFPFSKQSTIDR